MRASNRSISSMLILLTTLILLCGLAAPVMQAQATGTLIVLNKAEASASLIDLATGEEIARIETGTGPHEVAVSLDGKTAVVANYAAGNSMSVIDLPGKRVLKVIDLGNEYRPHGILFLADGRHVVATAEAQQQLIVVDIKTGKVVKSIDTEAKISHMVALSTEKSLAFVTNIGSGTVTVVDLKGDKKIKSIATGKGAEGIGISPDGKEVWVSNNAADSLSVIDVESLEVVATLECTSFPIRVKFTLDGKYVLVSNARTGDVVVFDADSRKIIKRITMEVTAVEDKEGRALSDTFGDSPVPVGILMEPGGRLAYVANTNADVISVIDLESLGVVGHLKAGKEPDGMGYSPLVLKK